MSEAPGYTPVETQPGAVNNEKKLWIALHSLDTRHPGDLAFAAGDVVQVIDRSDGEWWQVQRVDDGVVGTVPANYFAPLIHQSLDDQSGPASLIDSVKGYSADDLGLPAHDRAAPRHVRTQEQPPNYIASHEHDIRVDTIGEELAPESHVWATYVSSAGVEDAELVDGWNKTLDVLLIFAGLFSAVVTSFVIVSTSQLQPDYGQVTALLTAHLLAAVTNGSDASYLDGVPSPAEILAFSVPSSVQAVNILWYAALGFSLASVLVAMLAKQWLSAYTSNLKANPHSAACERQRRFDGLHRWSLPYIMALLPGLLHASLFLFLTGLIIYLWPIDSRVSAATCVILGVIFAFYFLSGALAVFYTSCPYITPITRSIRSHLRFSCEVPQDSLITTNAALWLAHAKDPTAVSEAIRALSALPRRFPGYATLKASYIAETAFERLRSCFIAERRRGGTYCLRREMQYEAACYARTLVNHVDDSRASPRVFIKILEDPSLPIFMQLLGTSTDPNLKVLGLCAYQRFLHRLELERWSSFRKQDGSHDAEAAGSFLRPALSIQNADVILQQLNDYLKGKTFLQSHTICVAIETLGFAPLAWVGALTTSESPLEHFILPLIQFQKATRGGQTDIYQMLVSTLLILRSVHQIYLQQPTNMGAIFNESLLTIEVLGCEILTEEVSRSAMIDSLAYFGAWNQQVEGKFEPNVIVEELLHECDRRLGTESPSFCDRVAVTNLMGLLAFPAGDDHQMSGILKRIQANAITAASGFNLPPDSLLFNIAPQDPFPVDTVPSLLEILQKNCHCTAPWPLDITSILYILSYSTQHRQSLVDSAKECVNLILTTSSKAVANHLFWIVTEVICEAIATKNLITTEYYASIGVLAMFETYRCRYGLTPEDVHAWVAILAALPIIPAETVRRQDLLLFIEAGFKIQDGEEFSQLSDIRSILLQYSRQPTPSYSVESAVAAIQSHTESTMRILASDSEDRSSSQAFIVLSRKKIKTEPIESPAVTDQVFRAGDSEKISPFPIHLMNQMTDIQIPCVDPVAAAHSLMLLRDLEENSLSPAHINISMNSSVTESIKQVDEEQSDNQELEEKPQFSDHIVIATNELEAEFVESIYGTPPLPLTKELDDESPSPALAGTSIRDLEVELIDLIQEEESIRAQEVTLFSARPPLKDLPHLDVWPSDIAQ